MGLDGSLVQVSNGMNSPTREATVKATLQIPIQHFARTCSYIREQGAIDERFQVIEL